jgi:hypothetical protein
MSLVTIKADVPITDKQRAKLEGMAESWRGVDVVGGDWSLPPGYITIVLDPHGHPVHGGMSPEGEVST